MNASLKRVPIESREDSLTYPQLRAVQLLDECWGTSGWGEIRALPSKRQWFFELEDPEAVYDAIEHSAALVDEDVFFGIHSRTSETGTNDAVDSCRVVCADCDSGAALDALEAFDPKPSFVVQSGGLTETERQKLHAYWLLTNPVDPETARQAKKRIATALSSDDRIHDPARIMRLPTSTYHKNGNSRPVRVIVAEPSRRYGLDEIVGALPDAAEAFDPPTSVGNNTPAGGSGELALLVATAVRKITSEGIGRNEAMFALACQARDARIPQEQLLAEAPGIVEQINELAPRSHPYELSELRSSIKQAYSRVPRERPHGLPELEDWPHFGAPDLPTFPVDALPRTVGAFVLAVSEQMQVPVDLTAVLVFGVLSGAAVGGAYVDCGTWNEELGLYQIVAAASGERKSSTLELVKWPLSTIEAERMEAAKPRLAKLKARRKALESQQAKLAKRLSADDPTERSQAEGEYAQLQEELDVLPEAHLPRMFVNDITPEALGSILSRHGSAVFLTDESSPIRNLLGHYSDGRPNLDLVLNAYTGSMYTIDRKGKDPERLSRPTLSMTCAIQPHVLEQLVTHDIAREQGLVPRFIYVLAPTKVGDRKVGTDAVPADVMQEWIGTVRHVSRVKSADNADVDAADEFVRRPSVSNVSGSEPRQLMLDPKAKLLLTQLMRDLEPRLGAEGDLYSIVHWATRHPGRVVRLAGLMHLCEYEPEEPISERTMTDAMRIGEYLLAHARAALAIPNEDTRKAVDWLRRHGRDQVTQRDLHRGLLRGAGKADRARELADRLETAGAIRPLLTDHSTKRRFAVNPHLLGSPVTQHLDSENGDPDLVAVAMADACSSAEAILTHTSRDTVDDEPDRAA